MMPDLPCPICTRSADPLHTPFCSRGCRDRDLLAWLSDAYRVPAPAEGTDGLDSAEDRD